MKRRQFFMPNVSYWRWERVNRAFVRQMYDRSHESYKEMENALGQLDEDVSNIQQEIKGVWSSANVQMMRAFQDRLLEVRGERKRILNQQTKLLGVMDRLRAHLNETRAIHA